MKLRHGQLWRRLGPAVLSGILIASLAPSTIAAPIDGQDMRGDAQSADVDLSRSDAGVADPADSQDRAASDGADASESAESADSTESADAATASSQEESADVQTYVYPGTSGPTRVHVISTQGSDAILLESKGVFGMIDGGEGQGAPDGSDPRYPLRPGTTPASKGDTQRILDYMSSQGVTSSNLAFYLGTHPHSDHIDNADDIIYRFHPQVIFSPEYSDAWISNPNALWDNQWVYDRMIAAASWAQRSYGAQIVQHVRNYDTHVQLGDMDVQLIPFDPQESYQRHPIRDANLLGWGKCRLGLRAPRVPRRRPRNRGGPRGSDSGRRRTRRHAQGGASRARDLELRVVHGRPLALDDHPDQPRMGDPGPPDHIGHCQRHRVMGANRRPVGQGAHSRRGGDLHRIGHQLQRPVSRFVGT